MQCLLPALLWGTDFPLPIFFFFLSPLRNKVTQMHKRTNLSIVTSGKDVSHRLLSDSAVHVLEGTFWVYGAEPPVKAQVGSKRVPKKLAIHLWVLAACPFSVKVTRHFTVSLLLASPRFIASLCNTSKIRNPYPFSFETFPPAESLGSSIGCRTRHVFAPTHLVFSFAPAQTNSRIFTLT